MVKTGVSRTFVTLLMVVCIALAAEVVVLAKENRRLRGDMEAPAEGLGEPESFAPGDFLNQFELRRPDGGVEVVPFDGEFARTLLLVFAEDCGACSLVQPEWAEILDDLSDGTRIYSIQLDRDEQAPPKEDFLPLPIHTLTDVEGLPLEKFLTVPITLVVDAAGMILWSRYGNLGPLGSDSLRAALAE